MKYKVQMMDVDFNKTIDKEFNSETEAEKYLAENGLSNRKHTINRVEDDAQDVEKTAEKSKDEVVSASDARDIFKDAYGFYPSDSQLKMFMEYDDRARVNNPDSAKVVSNQNNSGAGENVAEQSNDGEDKKSRTMEYFEEKSTNKQDNVPEGDATDSNNGKSSLTSSDNATVGVNKPEEKKSSDSTPIAKNEDNNADKSPKQPENKVGNVNKPTEQSDSKSDNTKGEKENKGNQTPKEDSVKEDKEKQATKKDNGNAIVQAQPKTPINVQEPTMSTGKAFIKGHKPFILGGIGAVLGGAGYLGFTAANIAITGIATGVGLVGLPAITLAFGGAAIAAGIGAVVGFLPHVCRLLTRKGREKYRAEKQLMKAQKLAKKRERQELKYKTLVDAAVNANEDALNLCYSELGSSTLGGTIKHAINVKRANIEAFKARRYATKAHNLENKMDNTARKIAQRARNIANIETYLSGINHRPSSINEKVDKYLELKDFVTRNAGNQQRENIGKAKLGMLNQYLDNNDKACIANKNAGFATGTGMAFDSRQKTNDVIRTNSPKLDVVDVCDGCYTM